MARIPFPVCEFAYCCIGEVSSTDFCWDGVSAMLKGVLGKFELVLIISTLGHCATESTGALS